MEKLTGYLSGSASQNCENGKKADIKINIDKQKRLMQNIFAPFPCKDWSGLLLTVSRGKGACHE